MRIRLLMLTGVAVLATAGPAFAAIGAGGSAGNGASAGGTTVSSGSSSSSASVNTTGGTNVGVVQGNVAQGSTGSGSSGAAASNGNGGSSGSVAPAADTNAATDGVLKRLDLPAIGTATDATPASSSRPDALVWALAAAVVIGLALAYRRLPRPSSA